MCSTCGVDNLETKVSRYLYLTTLMRPVQSSNKTDTNTDHFWLVRFFLYTSSCHQSGYDYPSHHSNIWVWGRGWWLLHLTLDSDVVEMLSAWSICCYGDKFSGMVRERERETDRQTDRQTDRHTDRHTDRQRPAKMGGGVKKRRRQGITR